MAPERASTEEQRRQKELGLRLRALRQQAGFSINQLASRAGISVGMLSQTERGLSNPSVRILDKLSSVLGVSTFALVDGPPAANGLVVDAAVRSSQRFVRRANRRPSFDVGPALLHKEILSPYDSRTLRFLLLTFPPRLVADDVMLVNGEKAGIVMSGRFRLCVDNVVDYLDVGDSFQFDSSKPHWIENDTDTQASVLWIMVHLPQGNLI